MPITVQTITKQHSGSCGHYRVAISDGIRTWAVRLHLADLDQPVTDDMIETVLIASLKRWRAQGATPAQMVGLTVIEDAL